MSFIRNKNPRRDMASGVFAFFLIEPQASKNSETTATWSVVPSSSLAAEADFSSPAEAEPEVAALALPQVLVWLPVAEAVGLACSGEAELVVGALEAALVADAEPAGPERACSEPAEVLAADALAAEPVADAVAEELVADAAVVLAADELVAEPVAGAAEAVFLADALEVPAADELVAELVAGAAEAVLGPAYFEAEALAADELVAELVAGAAEADWAAAELGQELAAHRAVRWAVDCDSVERFAGPRLADGMR
jgi:hypothetical protein